MPHCCPVSWRSRRFGPVGPAPSHSRADKSWIWWMMGWTNSNSSIRACGKPEYFDLPILCSCHLDQLSCFAQVRCRASSHVSSPQPWDQLTHLSQVMSGGQWAAGTIPSAGSGDQGPLSVDFGMNMPLADCPDQECLHGFWEYYGSQTLIQTPGTAELQIKTWPSVAV